MLAALALTLSTAAFADNGGRLEAFPTCSAYRDALTDALTEQIVQGYGGYGYYWGGMAEDRASLESTAAPAAADAGGSGASAGPSSVTGTNVQEQGVDELDLVKTDGKFVYVANGGQLAIVKSWPAEDAEKVGAITLQGYPSGLFLHGDRVVVLSYTNRAWDSSGWSAYGSTRMTVIDVSDRTKPEIIREVDVEGGLVTARMVGDDVYAVLNQYGTGPAEIWQTNWYGEMPHPSTWAEGQADQERVRQRQRAAVRPKVAAILAKYDAGPRVGYADRLRGGSETTGSVVDCNRIYYGGQTPQMGLTSIVRLDVDSDTMRPAGSAVFGNGWTVYASTENLYVAGYDWNWWGYGQNEPGTTVHKFELSDESGKPRYVASGKVDGWLWNQFAMSEHEGKLRIATTDTDWWWGSGRQGTGSAVTVLGDDHEGRLYTVGSVTGIAPGEQIYGVRFVGDTGYLVTFRQIDPLHVLDLSDPRHPKVTGELQIPGYSAYLHPIDEGHLLAVGMDGDMNGRLSGIKVSIFDVTDKANPKESHKYTIGGDGWAWSEAMWDHHAFTYHDGKLALPISASSYGPDGAWTGWSGMLVMQADVEEGIREIGRVDHREMAGTNPNYGYYGYYGGGWMRRSLFLDDVLVTVSDVGVQFNDLDRPRVTFARVPLAAAPIAY
jgi:hypothetical protein